MDRHFKPFADSDRIRELIQASRTMLASGESVESVLGGLRRQGCSKAVSAGVIAEAKGVSLQEAKELVHLSETWRDAYQRDEALHNDLEAALPHLENEASSGES